MKKKPGILLALLLALTMLVAACGGSTSAAPSAGGEDPAPSTVSGDKQYHIGMVVKHASIEYIQAFKLGAEETCKELGIKLTIIDAQADTQKILNAIDTFITQEIDGFIMAGAEDLVSLVPGIKKLNELDIPVMALDTCPEGGHVDMFITFDIADSTEKAARQMIEGIKEANNGEVPEGVVVEITGSLVDMFTTLCHEGFMRVMDEYPQLTISQGEGHWNDDDSFARTSDLFTRHGDDIVAVYVHTPDIMGAGVVSAIENAGRNPADYFISGICLGKVGVDLMKEGKLYAVVEQPALESAIMAVRYLNDIFNGVAIPQVGDTVEEDGALWSPAEVVENTDADSGATMILQAPLVPQEVPADDPRLWENRI